MSLSFVSSAVQTGRSDGGYDEVQIESKEKEAVNKRNEHKPLFEQLRKNQEEEDAKQEEMQLQMMRGTCALDEDDVAYLDSLEKRKLEKQREIQQQTQDEIAMFRAARVQKQESTLDDDDDDDDESDGSIVPLEKKMKPVEAEPSKAAAPVVKKGPMIVIKKRKRKGATAEPTNEPKALESERKEQPEEKKGEPKQEKAEKSNQGGGLGGLLGGYGSSDDNSD